VSRPQKSLDDAKTVHNDAASGKKTATFRLLGLTRFVSSGGGVVHTATIEPVGEKTSKFPLNAPIVKARRSAGQEIH